MKELNATAAMAYRDFMKFVRDRARVLATFIFPVVFIGILGGSFQASMGPESNFDYLPFIFTGVLAQTLFQSTAMGLVSLIEDRENDFSQEIFVAPISRYSIIFGKISGETLVALTQGAGILVLGFVLDVGMGIEGALRLLPVSVVVCLYGGSFGVVILSNVRTQRAANQIFPFIMLPQLFTSGVFTPVNDLPPVLSFLSHISPMRYAVDLTRGVFYAGSPEYEYTVAYSPAVNLVIMTALFAVFLVVGTWTFVKRERDR